MGNGDVLLIALRNIALEESRYMKITVYILFTNVVFHGNIDHMGHSYILRIDKDTIPCHIIGFSKANMSQNLTFNGFTFKLTRSALTSFAAFRLEPLS